MGKKSENNEKVNFFTNKWVYVVFTIVFFVITFFLFGWKRDYFYFQDTIKSDLFGQIGDFSSGILGTIFALISTLLLIRTLHQQQQITKENKTLTEAQRFNDLFFELINLYQEQTKELQDREEYTRENNGITEKVTYTCNNKDFFDYNKKKTQEAFVPQASFRKNLRNAQNTYSTFYLRHKSKLAIYYRTLYRIFDLIQNSNLLEETSKRHYAKILRAQLTESELFFLRYNALTYYGENFVFLINRYNILKHLPHFELLEFKDWWEHLSVEERSSIDVLFCIMKDMIKDAANQNNFIKQQVQIPSLRYSIFIKLIDKSNLSVEFKINTEKHNTTNDYVGLDKFSKEQIQALLDCFLKELIIFSNFKRFNIGKNLDFYSAPITTRANIITITCSVKNKLNEKLNFNYTEK